MRPDDPLPIDAALPALRRALAQGSAAVLQAMPGAGKTTRVPLALLDQHWLAGRTIVMLEPRRLAARAAAHRLAESLGERVGDTVGYRIRSDSRVSARTRLEVVTEGILTRRLQGDQSLEGVGLVIFDEFHERSLQADLGLALVLDMRPALRPDLKILVMSATLDGTAVARLLGGAQVIRNEGRLFPVETRHVPRSAQRRFEDDMAALILRAIAEASGSLLAFLPGEREIRGVAGRLERAVPDDVAIKPLYGALPMAAQDEAIRPSPPGRRKIVLATTIAETSLTIDGVSIVVDGGLKRVPRFDPRTGMARLVTAKLSLAAAAQRRGRAGRLAPGVCYRLWSEAEERGFAAFDRPEILDADLAPLALDLALWGVRDPSTLAWLDAPPPANYAQAQSLLRDLGALDGDGRITAMGRRMAELPLHPRLAHMVLKGRERGQGRLACRIAALLSERDFWRGERDCDIRLRLEILPASGGRRVKSDDRTESIDRAALARVREAARELMGIAGIAPEVADRAAGSDQAGVLLAHAYPDRIAGRRGAIGSFLLSGGGGAVLPASDPLAAADYLVAAELDGVAKDSRIFLAAPIDLADLEGELSGAITEADEIVWDGREEAVVARRRRKLGALVLAESNLRQPDGPALTQAMIEGIHRIGMGCLPWTKALRAWQQRVLFARRVRPDETWPDLSDMTLASSFEVWLAPYLAGVTRREHLTSIDLAAALRGLLDWRQGRRLDEIAPTHVRVPSGSAIVVDYGAEGGPLISVRLQEVFGMHDTPTVDGGRVPVTLQLLSPAQRPLALTRDLASFWANVYPQVRAEMRGRYPKHAWPEDPLAARPAVTRRQR